ncbi:MAG: mechanosensitive ion channel [Myxococcales bacterium FL481]|nr:MAG: mechanosensitive ion channel [Myxococcales bacterium FL481]
MENIEALLAELAPQLLSYGVRIVGVLFALWIAFRVAAWADGRLTRTLKARKIDPALSDFLGNLVRWTLIVAAVLSCLSIFGIETTSFAAVLGAAGLAVGLAFQGTLSNFSAGVMIVTFRPFTIGDLVSVDGHTGFVAHIGLFTTSLDTLDHRRIIVPNSTVMGGSIENMTFNGERRVDIDVGTAYDADLDQVRKVLEDVAASVPGRDPERGHQVILLSMGDSSITWQVRVWCKTEAYWDVWDATTRGVKQALDKADISIPFPQMDVHLPKAASGLRPL